MPDEASGKEVDVNTDAGFNAALAKSASGGEELSEETKAALAAVEESDTSIAAGLVIEESAQTPSRDEQGRFAPAAPPEKETEEAAPAEEGGAGEESTVDPTVAAFLSRHGDDPNAAIAAALKENADAQSLIGRQGTEVGDLRQALARFEGRLEEVSRRDVAPPQLPRMDEETVAGLEQMVSTHGGRGMMGWVVQNRPDLIEAAEEVWAAEDPLQAADFRSRRAAYEVLGQAQQAAPQAPQRDEFLETLRVERQMSEVVGRIKSAMPEGEWEAVKDQLIPTLEAEQTPQLVKNAVVSQDPNQQMQGLSALVEIARSRALVAATAKATEDNAQQLLEKKKGAQVATGALRPASKPQPGDDTPKTKEEIRKAFHEALLATPSTSVQEGLVYSK